MKTKTRSRLWVGLIPGGSRAVFRSVETPTQDTHGKQFAAVIGPFRTRAGAEFMRAHGGNGNPHCRTVSEAEHAARGEAYDLVLGRWVKTRAAGDTAADTGERFDVFHRVWWREPRKGEPAGFNGLVPYPGAPRTYLARNVTESEAREICREWNSANDPGRYSRKAEFTSAD